jgi:uncharacterized protein YjbJ (UPF0337 family)
MNWEQVGGSWNTLKARVRQKWAKLTDDDVEAVKGRRDELIGRLQQRYGHAKEEIEREVDEFIRKV